MHSLGHKSTA
uniref:Uncharacterized protein n=1 Tax=Moniliophthora roreri TaxID=221103 RepID=A0A0W0F6D0_MONRR